jgi:hypothetical protein
MSGYANRAQETCDALPTSAPLDKLSRPYENIKDYSRFLRLCCRRSLSRVVGMRTASTKRPIVRKEISLLLSSLPQQPSQPNQITGTWINQDPATTGITHVLIEEHSAVSHRSVLMLI